MLEVSAASGWQPTLFRGYFCSWRIFCCRRRDIVIVGALLVTEPGFYERFMRGSEMHSVKSGQRMKDNQEPFQPMEQNIEFSQ